MCYTYVINTALSFSLPIRYRSAGKFGMWTTWYMNTYKTLREGVYQPLQQEKGIFKLKTFRKLQINKKQISVIYILWTQNKHKQNYIYIRYWRVKHLLTGQGQ